MSYRILIDRGADLSAVNNEGEVPLDLAEEEDMEDFISEEIEARSKFMLELCVSINYRRKNRQDLSIVFNYVY